MKPANGKGFSWIELIIAVAVIGACAAIVVPRLNYALVSKSKAETTARKIVTDLRRTRSLAISEAATNSDGYGLTMVGTGPYTRYDIRNEDTDAIVDSHVIDASIVCNGGQQFIFGRLGNLKAASDNQLSVSGGGKNFTISIVRATGSIKCSEN
ncbi:MAG: pilus assembly FimT family protein [Planctomycetota bacterium]|jgi:prepilin-type N-terminal cleavage/methylation domain-containing protein